LTITLKSKADLVVPSSVQRRAGIKEGDRLEFKVSSRSITITAIPAPTYKPTKAELAAIRKGEAQIARGECMTLTELLNGLEHPRSKGRAKAGRRASR
jgi:bifunctional DNA-binding transcriptional regulator/antitoxin component of YhaV-PrlF toxin-antitoxin module